ncbi:hypothetical protein [Neotamlana laminarinivorans]|uniref:Uncharacterized protein n=1 Tax=Neotamlana laminarinivorans TaxID=2883124 RepID=A0A9X1I1X6_9FLAO|nr:hypothetical protein [Tamlana laminarinivorans]MCB4799906.1 hypothetical protein [Tamlana laminarinivorans]
MSKPPGKPIKSHQIETLNLNSTIEFSFNSSSEQPLQPLVQAIFNENNELQVSAVVFIASEENFNFKGVNFQSVISGDGTRQVDFFILYDDPEVSSEKFNVYRVDFRVKKDKLPQNLGQIEVFLWDEDPVTSRGTVTPVHGSGGE